MAWIIIGSAAAIVVALVLCALWIATEMKRSAGWLCDEIETTRRNVVNHVSRIADVVMEERALRQSLADKGGDRCRCYVAPMTVRPATDPSAADDDTGPPLPPLPDPMPAPFDRIGAPVRASSVALTEGNAELRRSREADVDAFSRWEDGPWPYPFSDQTVALRSWAWHLHAGCGHSAEHAVRRARNVEIWHAWDREFAKVQEMPF